MINNKNLAFLIKNLIASSALLFSLAVSCGGDEGKTPPKDDFKGQNPVLTYVNLGSDGNKKYFDVHSSQPLIKCITQADWQINPVELPYLGDFSYDSSRNKDNNYQYCNLPYDNCNADVLDARESEIRWIHGDIIVVTCKNEKGKISNDYEVTVLKQ